MGLTREFTYHAQSVLPQGHAYELAISTPKPASS